MIATLKNDLRESMKERNKPKVNAIRNMLGKLRMREIELGDELSEKEIISVLTTSSNQLKDSIEQYSKGGRDDLASKESEELNILTHYLPEQSNEKDIRLAVKNIIKETGAKGLEDLGKVMGPVMSQLHGKADGKVVNKIVREELS